MDTLGKIIVIFLGMFFIFSPFLIGIGYILYNFIIKKLISRKNKHSQKKEKQKILFYNLWLPLEIVSILFITPLVVVGTGFGFWIFYALYHLFYKIRTKHTNERYYGGKESWIIFVISCIIFLMSVISLVAILVSLGVKA